MLNLNLILCLLSKVCDVMFVSTEKNTISYYQLRNTCKFNLKVKLLSYSIYVNAPCLLQ